MQFRERDFLTPGKHFRGHSNIHCWDKNPVCLYGSKEALAWEGGNFRLSKAKKPNRGKEWL